MREVARLGFVTISLHKHLASFRRLGSKQLLAVTEGTILVTFVTRTLLEFTTQTLLVAASGTASSRRCWHSLFLRL